MAKNISGFLSIEFSIVWIESELQSRSPTATKLNCFSAAPAKCDNKGLMHIIEKIIPGTAINANLQKRITIIS
jgi:hypothetical protein